MREKLVPIRAALPALPQARFSSHQLTIDLPDLVSGLTIS